MYFGLVPITVHVVEWTTPPFINGYLSTGSIAGTILQLFLVLVGIFKVLSSERSVDIITAITELSKKFNFKVVAEYVETKEQRDKLADLGCHIYQGWLYSQAVPLEVFARFLNEHRT